MLEIKQQLRELHRQHEEALVNYDFIGAANIYRLIKALRREVSPSDYTLLMKTLVDEESSYEELPEDKRSLINDTNRLNAYYSTKKDELIETQRDELERLDKGKAGAIGRESNRVVPAAQYFRENSYLLGKSHQYLDAQKLYEESNEHEDEIRMKRIYDCKKSYSYLKRRAEQRHRKEIEDLVQKRSNAIKDRADSYHRERVRPYSEQRYRELGLEKHFKLMKKARARTYTQ